MLQCIWEVKGIGHFKYFTIENDNEKHFVYLYGNYDSDNNYTVSRELSDYKRYKYLTELLLNGETLEEGKTELPFNSKNKQSYLYKNKSYDQLISIMKYLYGKPYETELPKHIRKCNKMGLKYIRDQLEQFILSEYITESRLLTGLHVIRKTVLDADRKNLNEAYDNLKENKWYQEVINEDIQINYNVSGIYEIVNINNSIRYIGYSEGIKTRWETHKFLLRKGIHHCKELQESWMKYGEDSFRFGIVECCKGRNELKFKERYWYENIEGFKYNSSDSMMSKIKYENETLKRRVAELESQLKQTS